jgi:hypothetical protein
MSPPPGLWVYKNRQPRVALAGSLHPGYKYVAPPGFGIITSPGLGRAQHVPTKKMLTPG